MSSPAITVARWRAQRRAMFRSAEARSFTAALAVWVLHVLDDAFVDRQPGVPVGQHLVAALVTVAIATAAIWAFPRARPGVRSLVALTFGVFALADGMVHVIHIGSDGPAASDLTGALAAAAGAALALLAAWIPYRHRGERADSRARRWINRVVAVGAGVVTVYAFVFPVTVAMVATHKYREAIGAPPSAAYRPVTFDAADGLRLSGWYVPSRNRAAVVIVHGGGGDRTGTLRHAALLARHGYGVLAYDARGRGASQGAPNTFGWDWDKDIEGALAFLRHRPDVDAQRIGGLGLSTGADVLIQVASRHRDDLRAVVSDGATAESLADARNGGVSASDLPYWAVMYTAASVLSGASPGPALEDAVAKVAPTPLMLISAGTFATEGRFNEVYARVARRPFEFWQLVGVGHTAAVRERPAAYEHRVIGFLDRALLGERDRRSGASPAS